jgi:hypothetical protein
MMPTRSHLQTLLTCAVIALLLATMPPSTAGGAGLAGTWQGVGLSQLAESLTAILGRPLVLDCRVDPTTPITLNAKGLTPEQLLDAISERCGAEVVILTECVRLAPAGRRAALQAAEETRAAEAAAAPARLRRSLAERQATDWLPGATPREVVTRLAEAANAPITGLELIPHDHLRAVAVPRMSRGAVLDLVLAGYDLRAAVSASGFAIVRLDPKAQPATPPRLQPPAAPADAAMPDAALTRFTLEAAAPLDQLLTAIADQTGLTLRIDQASLNGSGIDPRRVVRVKVDDVSRDELLTAITAPLTLTWRIVDQQLEIRAGLPPPADGPAGVERPRD